jgi:hypothetical protein
MVLWKNNIADFNMKMQANSDPENLSDCMVVTPNNDDLDATFTGLWNDLGPTKILIIQLKRLLTLWLVALV